MQTHLSFHQITPNADTFYRRVKRKESKEILKEFSSIQKKIISKLKKRRIKRIIVLIDEHEIPWFGESNEYVVGTKNFDGTKLCYKPEFANISFYRQQTGKFGFLYHLQ